MSSTTGSPTDRAADRATVGARITLVRHGRPDVRDGWIPAAAFGDFWRRYDEAGITASSRPSTALRDTLSSCDLLVTSTLPRAQQSLERIVPGASARVDARFREIGIPSLDIPVLRLPGSAWSAVGRLAWLARLDRGDGCERAEETVGQAARRVRGAARLLEEWSAEHAHIGVVTHGFFNGWLVRELRRLGWRGARLGTPRHWWSGTLTRPPR